MVDAWVFSLGQGLSVCGSLSPWHDSLSCSHLLPHIIVALERRSKDSMAKELKYYRKLAQKSHLWKPDRKEKSHWLNKRPSKFEHCSLENSLDPGHAHKLEEREQRVHCRCWVYLTSAIFCELRYLLDKLYVVQTFQLPFLVPWPQRKVFSWNKRTLQGAGFSHTGLLTFFCVKLFYSLSFYDPLFKMITMLTIGFLNLLQLS